MSNSKPCRPSNKPNTASHTVTGNSLVILDSGSNNVKGEYHVDKPRKSSAGTKRELTKRPESGSSLEILPAESDRSNRKSKQRASKDDAQSNTSRPSSSSGKQRKGPPVVRPDSAPRRTPTPSKQVALQAVQRKKEGHWDENESVSYSRPSSSMSTVSSSMVSLSLDQRSASNLHMDSTSTDSAISLTSEASSMETLEGAVGGQDVTNKPVKTDDKADVDIDDSDEFDTDLEDGEDDESESEEEEVRAPNELFMEFLSCVMHQDYENAKKLCAMILIYEPDHQEALKFQALIDEKIEVDAQKSTDDSDDDSDDDEDASSDDDNDDDESSDDSSDEDEETSSENEHPITTDSGVSSATELP